LSGSFRVPSFSRPQLPPDFTTRLDGRPAGRHHRVHDSHGLSRPLVLSVVQPSSVILSLSSDDANSTVGSTNVGGQGSTDHRPGLACNSGTVDEPRPTTDPMHGNEEVLNETLGVSGGDVHSQTYMSSNHRRPLGRPDSSGNHDNNNDNHTEPAPKTRRVDSRRIEVASEPAVVSGEPRNGMGLDSLHPSASASSALSPLNGSERCVDAPPAYESAWAMERRVRAG